MTETIQRWIFFFNKTEWWFQQMNSSVETSRSSNKAVEKKKTISRTKVSLPSFHTPLGFRVPPVGLPIIPGERRRNSEADFSLSLSSQWYHRTECVIMGKCRCVILRIKVYDGWARCIIREMTRKLGTERGEERLIRNVIINTMNGLFLSTCCSICSVHFG